MTLTDDPVLSEVYGSQRPNDVRFMQLALAQARNGCGRTSPNPAVGCVIVRGDRILGQGYHARVGFDHAEVAAIKDARARGESLAGSTLYVTLEPCCSHGRTPPCTDAILKHGVARVVAAMVDPDARMQGRGLKRLHDAGVAVTCGVLEAEARSINAPFTTRILQGRPHVTAKVAMSLDGRIATRSGDSFPLTGERAREVVHVLRDRIDVILVGRGTVEQDDPRLTCRLDPEKAGGGGPRDPVRVVVDPQLNLATSHRIFQWRRQGLSDAPTWVLADEAVSRSDKARTLDGLGVEVIACPRLAQGGLDLSWAMAELARRELCSVLVEGGGVTLAHFFEASLIDAWVAHIAPVLIGGERARSPLEGLGVASLDGAQRLSGARTRLLGDDIEIAVPVAGALYGLD